MCLNEVQALTQPSQTRIKKCCGEGAVFKDTKSSCVTMKGSHYRIDLGEGRSTVAGFPPCAPAGHMVIAGKLAEAELKDNGSLWLSGAAVLLPAGDFCLEHVLENAGKLLALS